MFQAHLKSHAGEYTFTCTLCTGRYKTEKTLMDHMALKHGVKHQPDEVVVDEEVEVVEEEIQLQE